MRPSGGRVSVQAESLPSHCSLQRRTGPTHSSACSNLPLGVRTETGALTVALSAAANCTRTERRGDQRKVTSSLADERGDVLGDACGTSQCRAWPMPWIDLEAGAGNRLGRAGAGPDSGVKTSRSPQRMSVGAVMALNCATCSSVIMPAAAARQTRAGTFRLSATKMSICALAMGVAVVSSWKPRANAGSMGSSSFESTDSQKFDQHRVRLTAIEASHEHQAQRALRIGAGEVGRNDAAQRMPNDDRLVQIERIQEAGEIGSEIVRGIALHGAIGIAMSPLGQRHRVDRIRQLGEQQFVGAPGVGKAVQEDNRRAVGIALRDVGQPEPARQLDLPHGIQQPTWGHGIGKGLCTHAHRKQDLLPQCMAMAYQE